MALPALQPCPDFLRAFRRQQVHCCRVVKVLDAAGLPQRKALLIRHPRLYLCDPGSARVRREAHVADAEAWHAQPARGEGPARDMLVLAGDSENFSSAFVLIQDPDPANPAHDPGEILRVLNACREQCGAPPIEPQCAAEELSPAAAQRVTGEAEARRVGVRPLPSPSQRSPRNVPLPDSPVAVLRPMRLAAAGLPPDLKAALEPVLRGERLELQLRPRAGVPVGWELCGGTPPTVLSVAPDSPAFRCGLRPGMQILRLGSREGPSSAEAAAAASGASGDLAAAVIDSPLVLFAAEAAKCSRRGTFGDEARRGRLVVVTHEALWILRRGSAAGSLAISRCIPAAQFTAVLAAGCCVAVRTPRQLDCLVQLPRLREAEQLSALLCSLAEAAGRTLRVDDRRSARLMHGELRLSFARSGTGRGSGRPATVPPLRLLRPAGGPRNSGSDSPGSGSAGELSRTCTDPIDPTAAGSAQGRGALEWRSSSSESGCSSSSSSDSGNTDNTFKTDPDFTLEDPLRGMAALGDRSEITLPAEQPPWLHPGPKGAGSAAPERSSGGPPPLVAPLRPPSPAAAAAAEAAATIEAFYRARHPEKLPQLGKVLDRYRGREQKMLFDFAHKYPDHDFGVAVDASALSSAAAPPVPQLLVSPLLPAPAPAPGTPPDAAGEASALRKLTEQLARMEEQLGRLGQPTSPVASGSQLPSPGFSGSPRAPSSQPARASQQLVELRSPVLEEIQLGREDSRLGADLDESVRAFDCLSESIRSRPGRYFDRIGSETRLTMTGRTMTQFTGSSKVQRPPSPLAPRDAELMQRVIDAEASLQKLQKRVEQAEAEKLKQVSERQRAVDAARKELAESRKALEAKIGEVEQRRGEVSERLKQCDAQRQQIGVLEAELGRAREAGEQARAELRERDEAVARLQEQVAARAREVEAKEQELSRLRASSRPLEETITHLKFDVTRLQGQVTALTAENQEYARKAFQESAKRAAKQTANAATQVSGGGPPAADPAPLHGGRRPAPLRRPRLAAEQEGERPPSPRLPQPAGGGPAAPAPAAEEAGSAARIRALLIRLSAEPAPAAPDPRPAGPQRTPPPAAGPPPLPDARPPWPWARGVGEPPAGPEGGGPVFAEPPGGQPRGWATPEESSSEAGVDSDGISYCSAGPSVFASPQAELGRPRPAPPPPAASPTAASLSPAAPSPALGGPAGPAAGRHPAGRPPSKGAPPASACSSPPGSGWGTPRRPPRSMQWGERWGAALAGGRRGYCGAAERQL